MPSVSCLYQYTIFEGADPNGTNRYGSTALHHAAANGRAYVATLLLAHGASLKARTDGGRTPLDLAKERLRHSSVSLACATIMLLDCAERACASGRTLPAVVAAAAAAASAAVMAVEIAQSQLGAGVSTGQRWKSNGTIPVMMRRSSQTGEFMSGGATTCRKPSKEAVEATRQLATKASRLAATVAAEERSVKAGESWPEARLARNGAAAGGTCAALYIVFGGTPSDARQAGAAVSQRVQNMWLDVIHSARRIDSRLEPIAEAAAREAVLRAALAALGHWHSEVDLAEALAGSAESGKEVRAHASLQALVAGIKRRRCKADDKLEADLERMFAFGGGGGTFSPLCTGKQYNFSDKERSYAAKRIQQSFHRALKLWTKRSVGGAARTAKQAVQGTAGRGVGDSKAAAAVTMQEVAKSPPGDAAYSISAAESISALQQQLERAEQSEAAARSRESQKINALVERQAQLDMERGRVGELQKALEQVKAEHLAAQAAWHSERGVDDDADAYEFSGLSFAATGQEIIGALPAAG